MPVKTRRLLGFAKLTRLQKLPCPMFIRVGALKTFAIFAGKRDSNTGVFLKMFKIFKNTSFIELFQWLLLRL